MSFLSILVFLIVFGIVVLVHELGHFWAAKKARVRVEEFGLGLPPRLWGIKKGETIYSLNWIPFGGFVRLAGEGESTAGDPERQLRNKGFWERALVIVAGVLMNFALAYVLIAVGFWAGMPPIASDPAGLVTDPSKIVSEIRVSGVQPDSPAEKGGLMIGDVVESVNEVPVSQVVQLQSLVAASNGEVRLLLNRSGQEVAITMATESQEGREVIGVFADEFIGRVNYVWWQVPVLAAKDFGGAMANVGQGIFAFLADLFTTGEVSTDVSGPLGIAQITAVAVKFGFLTVLQFLILLSINLGFVNILPIPALDGGRLVLLILEKSLFRKNWNLKLEAAINGFGFLALLLLIVLVTYRDILRIF